MLKKSIILKIKLNEIYKNRRMKMKKIIHIGYGLTVLCLMHMQLHASLLKTLRTKSARIATARCINPSIARSIQTSATTDQIKLAQQWNGTKKPFSFKDYTSMSASQISTMHQLADSRLQIPSNPKDPSAPKYSHPTLDADKLKELCEESRKLKSEHPREIVVGLGQSPAYLIEAAKTHAAKNGEDSNRFKHAAFSGSFYHGIVSVHPAITGRNEDLVFYPTKDLMPNQRQIESYQKYLTSLNLSPEHIAQHAAYNRKTLIIDNIVTGGGLASFILGILQKWAGVQDVSAQLEKALQLRIYPGREAQTLYKVSYPFQTHCINDHSEILTEFGHWYHHEDNRLMPKFTPDQWGKTDPKAYKIPLFANLACFKIVDHVANCKK